MRPFMKAFLATAVPIALLFAAASAGVIAGSSWGGFGVMAGVGTGLTIAAFIAGIVLVIMRRRAIAAGVFAGMGVGFLGLVVTCFASLTQI